MKKLLVFLCVFALSLSLLGCGESDSASAPADNTPTAEEQLAEEQAKADADYAQFVELMETLFAHENYSQELSALVEKYLAGEVDDNTILEAMKASSDDSQALLEAVKNAQWQTEYYKEHVELLTATVQSLADYELTNYESMATGDESKAAEASQYIQDYQANYGALIARLENK